VPLAIAHLFSRLDGAPLAVDRTRGLFPIPALRCCLLLSVFQAFDSLFVAGRDVGQSVYRVLHVSGVFGQLLFEFVVALFQVFVEVGYYFQVHGECFKSLVYGHGFGFLLGCGIPAGLFDYLTPLRFHVDGSPVVARLSAAAPASTAARTQPTSPVTQTLHRPHPTSC